jgi:hypothetical protein
MLNGAMASARIIALSLACLLPAACERSPSAPSTNEGLPQSADGRRTSIPGKAMDRAEDLKKEVDAYNKTIEDTIAQGTNDAPPKPAPKRGGRSSPTERPADPGATPPGSR